MCDSEPTEEDMKAIRCLLGSGSVRASHELTEESMQSYIDRIAADYDEHRAIAQDRSDLAHNLLKEVKDIVLTGTVGGVKCTENTWWPAELERIFGLKGFTAYDTEHGFTTVILPNGFGVIVSCPEYSKGDPALFGHLLLAHACRHMDPIKLENGRRSTGSHVCIEKMNTPEQRLMLEDFKKINGKDVVYTVGYIDRGWVVDQVNCNPELLDRFRF